MKKIRFLLFAFTMISGNRLYSQANNSVVKEVQAETTNLKKAFDNKDDAAEADSYYNIGEVYYNSGNFSKSEEYLTKSKNIYEKLNDKQNLEKVIRKLAQSQENQNKLKSAVRNYETASNIGYSQKNKALNSNDVSRLSSSSAEKKSEAIQKNIDISRKGKENDDLAASYSQMAELNVQQNNIPKAAENLNNAYEISKDQTPQQALGINQKLAEIYVDKKDYDKAIETKKKALKEDFVKKNSQEKVTQIQELADIYIKKDDKREAITLFKNAYQISIDKGHTLEARKSVAKLDSLYKTSGNIDSSIQLYRDFLGRLPNLVKNDRSLTDAKILEETESKISQLEKEKELKDELIRKKNILNYGLLATLFLLLILIGFIIWTLKKVKIKSKKIALQSLRREMNPHFIFNSLNSVNQFISTNNELEANQYLTRFSKLMRGVMENSAEDFIPFHQELDLLQNYLSLEKTRFADLFDFEIKVDDKLNQQNLLIPGMLIQPFLENAIWHGLRYRTEKGFLKVDFENNNQYLKITIEDNGIGIEESKKQKTAHQKNREGRGMKNTLERVRLLNDLYRKNITCVVRDSKNGVLVEIKIHDKK